MYRFKMRFLLVFCAGFAFATTNAIAASTVRILGKTTPTVPTKQNAAPHTITGSSATMRAATKSNSRVMTANRLKTTAPTSARISTISIPKIVDVTDKPQVNPNQNTVPSDVPDNIEEIIQNIINNMPGGEPTNISITGQYGVTVEQDGDSYNIHLTGIDGSEDPNDIYVYRDGQFRKFEFTTTGGDFSGNVNACKDWDSDACNGTVDVNVLPNNNNNNNG